MPRTTALLGLLAVALPAPAARADDARLKDVLALQELVRRTIAKAEPAVACVLVSRSDAYKKYGPAPAPADPGKLGRFDARAALIPVAETDEARRRFIKSLDLANPDNPPESFGSGVVIDEAGLVLTAGHVVQNATKVYVRLPGDRGSYADVHALDPRSDLAVLKLLDPPPGLKPLPPGDASKVGKGTFVLGLANPYAAGFRDGSPTASWGMVGNVRRRVPGPPGEAERAKKTLHAYGTLWQTDVRLSAGCSGGALLNLDGELIGLTTALAAVTGTDAPGGFAVPLDAGLRRIIDVLKRGEEVEYGFLGIVLDRDPPPGRGVSLTRVAGGSPAERAGLQGNETLVAIDGHPVRDNDDLFLYIGTGLAGNTVKIEAVGPNGRARTVDVKLAKFHVPGPVIAANRPPARGGLRVDHTSILGQMPGALPWNRAIPAGVVVREVLPGSSAEKALLQPGKVVTHVNNKPVADPAGYYDAMKRAGGRATLTLQSADGKLDQATLDLD